ncbi:MAG TPA: hypothetical protein VD816_05750 [Ohtaekwangia sp.]|nr:hypothetical protein [Ohtaekwangia sp.]
MKRALTIAIILSMALHCVNRLGILSHLYQKRQVIAYHLGLIAELPITQCSHEDHTIGTLLVPDEATNERLPINFIQTLDINLFVINTEALSFDVDRLLRAGYADGYKAGYYPPPAFFIFHPPLA